jgi:hypothetical protein
MLKLIETIQATWSCDWCGRIEERTDRKMPEGWGNGSSCRSAPGEHFCSIQCEIVSRDEWENAFEAAIETQTDVWEAERQEWREKNYPLGLFTGDTDESA